MKEQEEGKALERCFVPWDEEANRSSYEVGGPKRSKKITHKGLGDFGNRGLAGTSSAQFPKSCHPPIYPPPAVAQNP